LLFIGDAFARHRMSPSKFESIIFAYCESSSGHAGIFQKIIEKCGDPNRYRAASLNQAMARQLGQLSDFGGRCGSLKISQLVADLSWLMACLTKLASNAAIPPTTNPVTAWPMTSSTAFGSLKKSLSTAMTNDCRSNHSMRRLARR
jgi:hypothetical protein